MFAPERGEHLQPLKPAASLGAPAAFLCTPEAKGNAGTEGAARPRAGGPPKAAFVLGFFREKSETNGIRGGERDRAPPGPGDAAGAAAGAAGMGRRGQAPARKLLSTSKAIRMSAKKVLTRGFVRNYVIKDISGPYFHCLWLANPFINFKSKIKKTITPRRRIWRAENPIRTKGMSLIPAL